jgi:hypothetical protein
VDGYFGAIEALALSNTHFRQVLSTREHEGDPPPGIGPTRWNATHQSIGGALARRVQ